MRQLRRLRRGAAARSRPTCPRSSRWARGSSTPSGGSGTVQGADDETLTVVFDTVGYKTLALGVVEERGLLEPE